MSCARRFIAGVRPCASRSSPRSIGQVTSRPRITFLRLFAVEMEPAYNSEAMTEDTSSTAGIILIGDEILSGKVDDENARFLIFELRELGVALRRIAVIPDVVEGIASCVGDFAG